MKKQLLVGLLGSCAATVGAQTAAAQGADDSMFRRDRNVSVTERSRPEFQTPPIQAGAFLYQPRLELSADFNDNIFAEAEDEESDVIIGIRPTLNMNTTWSRHALGARASVHHKEYVDFGDESVTDFDLGFDGRLDFADNTEVTGGANYALLHEPRTSAGAANRAAEPIEYQIFGVFAGAQRELGRTRVSGRVGVDSYDYDDGELLLGGVIEQDDRDRDEFQFELRGDYAISPDTALFARGRYITRDHDLTVADGTIDGFSRTSDGYTIDVGADFDISNLIRGEVGVGYLTESFDDADFEEVDGLSVDGLVEWFATPLMTATFRAGRRLQPAAVADTSAYTETTASAALDYELLYNVILNGSVTFGEDDYEAIDRSDERFGASVGGTYLLNRNVGVSANYFFIDQDSSGLSGLQDYTVNRFMISLTLQR